MEQSAQFEKPTDDYLRVATVSPEVAIADVPANVESLTAAYRSVCDQQAELLVTPELSLVGYSTADLLPNRHVLEQTRRGLTALAEVTADGPAMVVGAPLEHAGLLYNCAVMLAGGRIAGVIPKSFLPNYKEFYEKRWFASGAGIKDKTITVGDTEVPFGTDLLFDINGTRLGVELCEDLFAPISPGTQASLAGAEVIVNLSASNELIGKAEWRKATIAAFTGKLACAYVYASAGRGESVADAIFGGHQMIHEAGRLVAERPPLSDDITPLVYDIDREYLKYDRLINQTYADQAGAQQRELQYRTIPLTVPQPNDGRLLRHVDPYPYVPLNPETLDRRCEEIFSYASHALAQRSRDSHSEAIVLGLSGGLDSTLALLIAEEARKLLDKPADFIHTITMPGPASSERTQDNASLLGESLGTTHRIKPIGNLAHDLLETIGHDQATEDITYENAQARMRTTLLMGYANFVHGFVQGTGDMSESAIGWCTFNGDHMSMYNPNAAIPKTLVRHLVSWFAERRAEPSAREVLHDILDTPISPELTGNGDLSQTTESLVGPYALNDFSMFEHLRHGSRRDKIGYLARTAFGEKLPPEARFTPDEIERHLNGFLGRHTASQWKRNVAADGPKYGTTSQSPRGDLRMAPNTSPNWFLDFAQ